MTPEKEAIFDAQSYNHDESRFIFNFVEACEPLDIDEFCATLEDAEREYNSITGEK